MKNLEKARLNVWKRTKMDIVDEKVGNLCIVFLVNNAYTQELAIVEVPLYSGWEWMRMTIYPNNETTMAAWHAVH